MIFRGAVITTLIYIIAMFNQLVALINQLTNAFAQIEEQLKGRYDLFPEFPANSEDVSVTGR